MRFQLDGGRVDAELDAALAAQSTPGARIRLRDRRKKEKALPSNAPVVDVTDAFLERYDKALEQARLEIRHPSIELVSETVAYALVGPGKIRIDLGRRYPVRIFSGDMNSGGRWYHTFWTEIPSAYRKAMHIDGAPVAEHDISACHLRLAYYAAGAAVALAAFGGLNLYALDGFDGRWRSAIKAGVNIMLNAKSLNGARGALWDKLDPALVELRPNAVDEILSGIKAAHPAVERFWHSDCGVGLQFVDSEIMRLAIERLLDRAVLALCVHDTGTQRSSLISG
jgi:hypothetical protein